MSLIENFKVLNRYTLYKYLPPERSGLFGSPGFFPNLTLAAASPSMLNDPYECKACLSTLEAEGKKADISPFYQTINKRYGIMCFARVCDSLEMWSRYADSGKGFVVGFEKSFLPFDIYDVIYSNSIPQAYYDTEGALQIPENIFYTKSLDWEYECESRCIIPKEALENGFLYVCEPQMIQYIIFGPHAKDDFKKSITDECEGREDLKHVLFAEMRPNRETFKLEPVIHLPSELNFDWEKYIPN